MPQQPDPLQALEACESFTSRVWLRIPSKSAGPPVAWRRDGLSALWSRLEILKQESSLATSLLEETQSMLGTARRWRREFDDQMADKMADGIEQRASAMSTRGLASEERMLSHRSRAITELGWQRRFDRAETELIAARDVLQTRVYALRDESMACQAQFRAISVAVEIQEI